MASTPIEYINKDICQVSSRVKIKHQVKLGRANQKKERLGAIFKYDFTSENSYSNKLDLSSVIINTNDYIVIEYKDKEEKESIYLSYPHLFNIKRIMKEALNWFYSAKYDNLFFERNDELFLNAKFKNLRVDTDLTIDKKMIAFKPAIVEKNDIYEEGLIMVLNNKILTGLTINEFECMYDIISNFDLYNNSLILTNLVLANNLESCVSNADTTTNKANTKIPKVDEFNKVRKRKVKTEKTKPSK